MAKIKILTSNQRTVEVDAFPFLPGLFAHEDNEGGGLFSVTHVQSCASVLSGVPEDRLELVRAIIGRLLWDKPAELIFIDIRYQKAIEEAKAVLTNHQRSERQEKRVTKDLDGKRQPASGSRWGYRRDIVTPSILVEAKTTKAKRYSIPFADLEFLKRQAYGTGRVPAYLISLQDSSEVVVLPDQDVGEDDLPNKVEYIVSTCRPAAKSLAITMDTVKTCIEGNVVKVKHNKNNYLIMGYEMFLDFAKKGVE